MKAVVNKQVCSLYNRPTRESTLSDEVLYGMVVDILDEPFTGWYRVRTHYNYEGLANAEDLLMDGAESWEGLPKLTVFHKNQCDVLSEPKVQGHLIQALPRGSVVVPAGTPVDGWQKVLLADGRTGFVPAAVMVPFPTGPIHQDEASLRKALVDTAMLYQGAHYRWGGKSPLGIDCSGLCSMAYMLCGIIIYRDARIEEGFPLHEIPFAQIGPGDLIFFPGHVAMYIGNDRYCHSTAKSGSNGFAVNSLNPKDAEYREDLHKSITQVGSYFSAK